MEPSPHAPALDRIRAALARLEERRAADAGLAGRHDALKSAAADAVAALDRVIDGAAR